MSIGERLRRLDDRVVGLPKKPIAPEEWCSKKEAAGILGVSVVGVTVLTANGDLHAAQLVEDGEIGVTRKSVAREAEWRASHSWLRRRLRGLGHTFGWLSPP